MARIGISINEVFRDFLGQLVYTYSKYIDKIDTDKTPITDFELHNYFNFASKSDYYKFILSDAALEIFGHADQMVENVMPKFNQFLMDIDDDEEHEVELVSREVMKAISSTYFFLSKLGCTASRVRFVKEYEDKWDGIDVLVTANPIALNSKPEGKISVKVNAPYNVDVVADYSIDNIVEFMENTQLRMEILSNSIIKN